MVVGTAMLDRRPIYCAVPQGSVLEAVLFCMYTVPLEDIIHHHGLQCMMYADNIQLYITCDGDQVPTGQSINQSTIKDCVGKTRHWMKTNMLTLNDRSDSLL